MARVYHQNCPIAKGLDVLGERWTLLVLRELIGGARRYADLRAALPGIATNLLADRLRELEAAGLLQRSELPPPAARTVYSLTEVGWVKVLPVIRAVANFGLDLLEPTESALSPLNGFLAGVLLGFNEFAVGRSGRDLSRRRRRPPIRLRGPRRPVGRPAGPARGDDDRLGR